MKNKRKIKLWKRRVMLFKTYNLQQELSATISVLKALNNVY